MTVFPRDLLSLDTRRKLTMFFGSVCHSNEMHSSFETGDHFENFGVALEPAPQGFEENEKMREALG